MSNVRDEIVSANDRIERIFLNWMRNVFIFLTVAIAIYILTDMGKVFSIISFAIALMLVGVALIFYWIERDMLTERGVPVNLRLDMMGVVMLFVFFFILLIIWKIVNTPNASI